jgi:hypothetical protein
VNSTDVAEIALMIPGDILFLYTGGVYDGSDGEERQQLERVMREYCLLPARDICNALLEYTLGVRLKIDFLRTAPTREFIHIGLSGTGGVV